MPSGLDAETKRQEAMAAQMQAMMKAQQAAGGVLPGMEHVMAQLGVGAPGAGAGGSAGSAARPQPARAPQGRAPPGRAQPGRAPAPAPQEEQMNWPEPEPGAIWEVVGGEETGGIIVRAGRELTSPQEKRRLSTSALIREEELVGDRLRYARVTGSGPLMGWVSLTIRGSGKPLVMKVEGAEGPGQEEAYYEEEYYPEQYSEQYGHFDAPGANAQWQNQNQWEAVAAAAPAEPEPPQPPPAQWPAPAAPAAPPEPAAQAPAAPEPAPVPEPEPEDELAWLRRLLEKAEMLAQFDKATEWVAETGCEESDMRSGEGVEELIEHLELKKFPANRLRKAVKALQDEPPPEKKAAQPAAAAPPPPAPAPAAAAAPPAPAAPAAPAAAPAPAPPRPAAAPAAAPAPAPAPAARAPARAQPGPGFQPPPRAGGPAASSSRAAPAEAAGARDLPSADALLAQLDSEDQRTQKTAPMPSVEDVLARIELDAAEEAPEVPDIEEVLAALERDAKEEAELAEAAEARSEFFKLSEETTVSLPGAKQWWQEPVLRLDGPKFNFAAAGLLGKSEYIKSQPDYSPDAERPPEDPKPPTGWFKSRPGLEERLASAEVVRGAKRAARVAKGSKASGGAGPPAEAARAEPAAPEAPE